MQAELLSVYMRSSALLSACTMPLCAAAVRVLSRAAVDTTRCQTPAVNSTATLLTLTGLVSRSDWK